jgi:formylglycine-generating enzyme required for sulfatase activity
MRVRPLLAIAVFLGADLGGRPAIAQPGFVLPRSALVTFRDCEHCPEMVVLPSGLAISQMPVTRRQFSNFAQAVGFQQDGWGCVWQQPEFKQDDNHPVVCVSMRDALRYAEWLSQVTGGQYRLPTVEEARFAAMGGEAGPYWWGQNVGVNRANCRACGSKWDGKGTAPVGSFSPNRYGVYDAAGNVWQWTSTCHKADCSNRILIGGSWSSAPGDLRVTSQIWNESGTRFNTYGIRVVKVVQ